MRSVVDGCSALIPPDAGGCGSRQLRQGDVDGSRAAAAGKITIVDGSWRQVVPSLTAGLQLTQRPPNSRQLGPRGSLVACRRGNLAQRRHCGPPSSGLCGYLTQSSSPSIGIRPGSFALLYPSALVSTPAPLSSVDPGLGLRCNQCWRLSCRSA